MQFREFKKMSSTNFFVFIILRRWKTIANFWKWFKRLDLSTRRKNNDVHLQNTYYKRRQKKKVRLGFLNLKIKKKIFFISQSKNEKLSFIVNNKI